MTATGKTGICPKIRKISRSIRWVSKNGIGSHAWIITKKSKTYKHKSRIYGAGPVDGHPRSMNSTRAERAGFLEPLIQTLSLAQEYNITRGKLTMHVDNIGSYKKGQVPEMGGRNISPCHRWLWPQNTQIHAGIQAKDGTQHGGRVFSREIPPRHKTDPWHKRKPTPSESGSKIEHILRQTSRNSTQKPNFWAWTQNKSRNGPWHTGVIPVKRSNKRKEPVWTDSPAKSRRRPDKLPQNKKSLDQSRFHISRLAQPWNSFQQSHLLWAN